MEAIVSTEEWERACAEVRTRRANAQGEWGEPPRDEVVEEVQEVMSISPAPQPEEVLDMSDPLPPAGEDMPDPRPRRYWVRVDHEGGLATVYVAKALRHWDDASRAEWGTDELVGVRRNGNLAASYAKRMCVLARRLGARFRVEDGTEV